MKPHIHTITSNFNPVSPPHIPTRRRLPSFTRHVTLALNGQNNGHDARHRRSSSSSAEYSVARRAVLLTPFLAAAGSFLQQPPYSQSLAEEVASPPSQPSTPPVTPPPPVVVEEAVPLSARIYDATAIGEPLAVGKDKRKVWEKLMNGRIVYLGEAEQVPTKDDRELELEIIKNLKKRCIEGERSLALAVEAFPSDLQYQLNQFVHKRIDGEELKSYVPHWPAQRWQEYEPLLNYCRDNEIRLVACGTPLKILRTVQAEGIRGLSKAERKVYAPPAGSGFISGISSISRRSSMENHFPTQSIPFGPSSYLSAQARVVEEYNMSQIILKEVADEGTGLLVVVTGANHVLFGSRGTGVPARISKKIQKKNQIVILLDPERQYIRREGDVPVADFLWYSAARPCSRNCFDRAEIARVMNAAGRQRDALPQDLQKGLDLGLVSPEVLQNFFDLEKYPLLSELTHRFQYERRKENFFEELDYVITDTLRGIVVDFFTVWLPAPTISFLSYADGADSMDALQGLLGSIPDNAFQKSLAGKDWNLTHRLASVLVGGLKLASVGFISSIGAVAASNTLYSTRKFLNPKSVANQQIRRSPILKTAVVYGGFLGISANLRYQIIAGIVEHRIADQFPSQTLLVNMLSFVVRTVNSYWGTQQWIDLARFTGLQTRQDKSPSYQTPDSPSPAALECNTVEEANIDEFKNE
ncbi:hypothetical protein COLO4_24867 [Corchorus olitorius]|uniref:Haem-binding uptake Tiki superfamily ChaN domain-containing protein n=1 Tax=Corchorus olitorius TaxID=93759 RepID=A0A1R3I632_9ROSI|nr:hypothetical protein COLO4_24867 [Corchorus olitorius]